MANYLSTNSHIADVVNGVRATTKLSEDFELIAFDYEATKVTESHYIVYALRI